MKSDKQLFISIIIANHNWENLLRKCLKSIFRSDYKNFELIVVDDNSTDNSVEIAKKFPCKVIELHKNVGQGFARNKGANNAKGEILFFIDSDTEVRPDALKIINEDFVNNDIDAVVGIVDKIPLTGGMIAKYMCLETHHLGMYNKQRYSNYFIALVGAIKKKLFNKMEGFKHPWMDDFEFNNRLPQNTKILLDKRLIIKHTYKGFYGTFKKFFNRSSFWINLQQNKKVDKIFFNLQRVLGVGFSLLTAISLLISFVLFIFFKQLLFLTIPIISIILFIILNANLFNFIRKETSILFTIYSIICRFSFSFAIATGSIFGKIKKVN